MIKKKKIEVKDQDTTTEEISIKAIRSPKLPALVGAIIKVSKKRNIVVNKQADNVGIKETWLGTELEFEYRLPDTLPLVEAYKFIDDQIPICKKKADDYFPVPTPTSEVKV